MEGAQEATVNISQLVNAIEQINMVNNSSSNYGHKTSIDGKESGSRLDKILNKIYKRMLVDGDPKSQFLNKDRDENGNITQNIFTIIHTFIHTHKLTYIHTYAQTYIHTYTQTYIYSYIRTNLHSFIHT